jgi:hypothetical protein
MQHPTTVCPYASILIPPSQNHASSPKCILLTGTPDPPRRRPRREQEGSRGEISSGVRHRGFTHSTMGSLTTRFTTPTRPWLTHRNANPTTSNVPSHLRPKIPPGTHRVTPGVDRSTPRRALGKNLLPTLHPPPPCIVRKRWIDSTTAQESHGN